MMNSLTSDQRFMRQAIDLAKRGMFSTEPNPRVGCVLVSEGQVISEGWHQYAGEAHAEINALNAVDGFTQGATCYVTLEPCSHQGKTGPCADALIEAGVARVVVGMTDPNPEVSGQGIQRLMDAGIDVTTGILEDDCAALNPGFIKRMHEGMPFVTCKLAMSLDGRTAMASGESKWITGEEARADVQLLRARQGAIITGSGTVVADDPSMTVRPESFPESFKAQGEVEVLQPWRVVIDAKRNLKKSHKILNLPGKVIVCTGVDPSTLDLPETVEVLQCPLTESGKVDLQFVIKWLAEQGINEVLVETGAMLAGAFVAGDLIDQLEVYIAPKLLGHEARGLLNLPGMSQLSDAIEFQFSHARPIGRDLCLTYVAKRVA